MDHIWWLIGFRVVLQKQIDKQKIAIENSYACKNILPNVITQMIEKFALNEFNDGIEPTKKNAKKDFTNILKNIQWVYQNVPKNPTGHRNNKLLSQIDVTVWDPDEELTSSGDDMDEKFCNRSFAESLF